MNQFNEYFRKITSSSQHNQMLRFAAPLKSCFGINHFWYFKITFSGNYSYLGTHCDWNEFCFENAMVSHFPCLRHPDSLQIGINLMKAQADSEYRKVVNVAWEKFQINFNINLMNRVSEGVEAFGFATCYNDSHAEQRLLNNLPLLRQFTKMFREEHVKLFQLIDENQINLPDHFGLLFYERQKSIEIPCNREQFMQKIGLGSICFLTPREKDVLKFISNGYPSSYIAQQLLLSNKTVENYIAVIKCKLSCSSKVELIHKARAIASTGYFDDSL